MLLLASAAAATIPPSSGTGPIRVAVAGDACPAHVCEAMMGALTTAGMAPTRIGDDALAKLAREDYEVLVLPNAPALPAAAAPAYFAFAQGGGHIAVLGGRPPRLNITAGYASLNLMDTYAPYRLRNAVSVEPLPAAAAIAGAAPAPIVGAVSGLSAVGFARGGQSAFVPLLHAVDRHNRSTGWALSAMVHTGGPYNGSVWMLSGVEDAAFLASSTFVGTFTAALKASVASPSVVSAAAAAFEEAGLEAQRAAVAAMGKPTGPPGFVKSGWAPNSGADDKHLMYADDGSRYFMLGGDYFRGMFNSSLDASTLAIDLRNAALSGLNTLRFYGFPAQLLQTAPSTLALLRQMHKDHGLRVLFTLPAYKDAAQKSKATVISRTTADASILANETWVLGYDLCNEPDDQYNWPGSLYVEDQGNKTLNELYPAASAKVGGWGDFEKAQCGGWSTTFDPEHCGEIDGPIRDSLQKSHPDLVAGFDAMSSIFGEWVSWRVGAIHSVDTNHLITVGHNALHALLPSNNLLDFQSHHSYPSDEPGNSSCTAAQYYNVTAVPKTLDIIAKLFPKQPITYGEFGSKTTAGLWEMYEEPLSVVAAPPTPPAPPAPPSGPGCKLPSDCVSGVASTLGWFLAPPKSSGQKPTTCANAWELAVKGNAGPTSAHHRCPAYAGTNFKRNPFYGNCEKEIIAAAVKLGGAHCDPSAKPDASCASLSIHDGAVWDIMSFLHSIAHGHDGALRWAMAEKPWVIGAQQNTWVGDYTGTSAAAEKAFDSYVSASKWGSTWYDGSPTGKLKPIALTTRFLSQYLAVTPHWTDPDKYNLTYVELPPSNSALGAGYTFVGPDCVFVGGPSGAQPAGATDASLTWKTDSGETANVMLYSATGDGSGTLTGQTSADATVTISPKAASESAFERGIAAAWGAASAAQERWQGRVEGKVGEVRWFRAQDGRPAVRVEALEGEVFTVHQPGPVSTKTDDGACVLTEQAGVPVNPALFGYNLEVYGTMTPNTFDDTAGLGIAKALHLGVLRYPGGTMSNVWDPQRGRYDEDSPLAQHGSYAKFRSYSDLIKAAGPAGTFSAGRFLSGIGGRAKSTIWDLNVFSFNASQACAQIEYIASLPPPPGGVHLLELGNELYDSGQGNPRFPDGSSYAKQMAPVISCARRILPKAKIAAVGWGGVSAKASRWTRGLKGLDVDALSLHVYSPNDQEVAAASADDRLSFIAGYSRQMLRHCLNVSAEEGFGAVPLWHTEFNYGLQKDIFFPELVFGALHGVFHASRILASIELHARVQALTFQTLAHPHPYPPNDSAFHPAMPVARISPQPNRPDLAQVSGTAQLVSHLAFHALRAGTMHPVQTSSECPLAPAGLYKQAWPISGTSARAAPPCVLAAAFNSADGDAADWTALAILNSCRKPVPITLAKAAASKHEVTTYNISDPGGWAPLPAAPDELPWASGPLRPEHSSAGGALPDGWPAPGLSFSLVVLRR